MAVPPRDCPDCPIRAQRDALVAAVERIYSLRLRGHTHWQDGHCEVCDAEAQLRAALAQATVAEPTRGEERTDG